MINKLIFQVQDLGPILMNEKNAHQLPPPINSKMRPKRAAVKNEIGISERLSEDDFSFVGDKKGASRNLLLLYGLMHNFGKRLDLILCHAIILSDIKLPIPEPRQRLGEEAHAP